MAVCTSIANSSLCIFVVGFLSLTASCGPTVSNAPIINGYTANERSVSYMGASARTGTLEGGQGYVISSIGFVEVNAGNGEYIWRSGCSTDVMTDTEKCTYFAYSAALRIERTKLGSMQRVCISSHDFPGRRGAIRVGSNPMITTDTDGCLDQSKSRRFQAKLEAGASKVTIRHVEWPYDGYRDRTFSEDGTFNEIVKLDRWRASQGNR